MKFSELLVAMDNTSLADVSSNNTLSVAWDERRGPEFVSVYGLNGATIADEGMWFGRDILNRYSLEEIDALYARWRVENE